MTTADTEICTQIHTCIKQIWKEQCLCVKLHSVVQYMFYKKVQKIHNTFGLYPQIA